MFAPQIKSKAAPSECNCTFWIKIKNVSRGAEGKVSYLWSEHRVGLLGENFLGLQNVCRLHIFWVKLLQVNLERLLAQHLFGCVPTQVLEATQGRHHLQDLLDQDVWFRHRSQLKDGCFC